MKYWHICQEYKTVAVSLFLSFLPSRRISWGWGAAARHSAVAAFYCWLFYVGGNSLPLEPVLVHPRTHTPPASAPALVQTASEPFRDDFRHDPKSWWESFHSSLIEPGLNSSWERKRKTNKTWWFSTNNPRGTLLKVWRREDGGGGA